MLYYKIGILLLHSMKFQKELFIYLTFVVEILVVVAQDNARGHNCQSIQLKFTEICDKRGLQSSTDSSTCNAATKSKHAMKINTKYQELLKRNDIDVELGVGIGCGSFCCFKNESDAREKKQSKNEKACKKIESRAQSQCNKKNLIWSVDAAVCESDSSPIMINEKIRNNMLSKSLSCDTFCCVGANDIDKCKTVEKKFASICQRKGFQLSNDSICIELEKNARSKAINEKYREKLDAMNITCENTFCCHGEVTTRNNNDKRCERTQDRLRKTCERKKLRVSTNIEECDGGISGPGLEITQKYQSHLAENNMSCENTLCCV